MITTLILAILAFGFFVYVTGFFLDPDVRRLVLGVLAFLLAAWLVLTFTHALPAYGGWR